MIGTYVIGQPELWTKWHFLVSIEWNSILFTFFSMEKKCLHEVLIRITDFTMVNYENNVVQQPKLWIKIATIILLI